MDGERYRGRLCRQGAESCPARTNGSFMSNVGHPERERACVFVGGGVKKNPPSLNRLGVNSYDVSGFAASHTHTHTHTVWSSRIYYTRKRWGV
jgi:hypothetical protein